MAKAKPKYRKFADWCRRVWLNEKNGRAYIISQIEVSDYGSKPSSSISAFFDIGDCSRSVCLDFCVEVHNDKDVAKIKRKLERFRNEWNTFEAKVLERIEQVQTRNEQWKAKNDN